MPPVSEIDNLRGACWSSEQLVPSNSAKQGLLHGVGSVVRYKISIELIAPSVTHQTKKKNHETIGTYQLKVEIPSVTCTNQAELSHRLDESNHCKQRKTYHRHGFNHQPSHQLLI